MHGKQTEKRGAIRAKRHQCSCAGRSPGSGRSALASWAPAFAGARAGSIRKSRQTNGQTESIRGKRKQCSCAGRSPGPGRSALASWTPAFAGARALVSGTDGTGDFEAGGLTCRHGNRSRHMEIQGSPARHVRAWSRMGGVSPRPGRCCSGAFAPPAGNAGSARWCRCRARASAHGRARPGHGRVS